MLELMLLINLLNSANKKEQEELIKGLQAKLMPFPSGEYLEYISPHYGQILFAQDLVYFSKYRWLADRSILLMYKDICVARFHTLVGIEHRLHDKYKNGHLPSMINLYRVGDKLMEKHGPAIYKGAGLLEPMMSQKLSELMIKEIPNFRLHIEKKFADFGATSAVARDFVDTLMKLEDKDLLLSCYGSFRHWGHPYINIRVWKASIKMSQRRRQLTQNMPTRWHPILHLRS